jgi:homoserine O-acetyltransferase
MLPDVAATHAYLQTVDQQSAAADANDFLYSILSSQDYAPEDQISKIHTKVYALNFDDDEFNPARLNTLEPVIQKVPHARYVIKEGTSNSCGHLTMAYRALWAEQVANFMQSLDRR